MPASFVIGLCVLSLGCARVMITRVSDSTYKDGLRFYRADLYLVVTDTGGKVIASVIPLPNKSQEYVLRTKGGIGATEASATLEGGWNLTQLGSKADTKVAEMITALTALAGGLQAGARAPQPPDTLLKPGLYRILFDKRTGFVCGLWRVPLQVRGVPAQEQEAKECG
jgi:hypothetical protein